MRGIYDGETVVKLSGRLIRPMVSMAVFPCTIWSECGIGGTEKEVVWEVVQSMMVDWCDTDMAWASSNVPSTLILSTMGKAPGVVPKV